MERGPLALFGAIVAVGLGPALWLGAQFGSIQIQPSRPPAVSDQHPAPEQLLGGAGAGDNPVGADDSVIGSTPQSDVERVTTVPATRQSTSPAPSRTSERPSPAPSTTTTGPGPSQSSSSGPSTPPTESTDDPSVPPEPPAGEDDPTEPAGPGDEGGTGAADLEVQAG